MTYPSVDNQQNDGDVLLLPSAEKVVESEDSEDDLETIEQSIRVVVRKKVQQTKEFLWERKHERRKRILEETQKAVQAKRARMMKSNIEREVTIFGKEPVVNPSLVSAGAQKNLIYTIGNRDINDASLPRLIPLNDSTAALPRGNSYMTVRQNFRACDQTKLKYLPYFEARNPETERLTKMLFDLDDSDSELEDAEELVKIVNEFPKEQHELACKFLAEETGAKAKLLLKVRSDGTKRKRLEEEKREFEKGRKYNDEKAEAVLSSLGRLFCKFCHTYDCPSHGWSQPRNLARILPTTNFLKLNPDLYPNRHICGTFASKEGNGSRINNVTKHYLPKSVDPRPRYPFMLDPSIPPFACGEDCYLNFSAFDPPTYPLTRKEKARRRNSKATTSEESKDPTFPDPTLSLGKSSHIGWSCERCTYLNKAENTSCSTCGKRKQVVRVSTNSGRRSARLCVVSSPTKRRVPKHQLIPISLPHLRPISKPAPSLPYQSDCETESEEEQGSKELPVTPSIKTPLSNKADVRLLNKTTNHLESAITKPTSDARLTSPEQKQSKLMPIPPGSPSTVEWASLEMFMLRKLIIVCGKNYCQIARILNSKSCHDVWRAVKDIFQTHAMLFQEGRQAPLIPHPFVDDRHTKGEESYNLDGVPHNFIPCFHTGSCMEKNCVCLRKGTDCQKYCSCSSSCKNRRRGCRCKQNRCRKKTCSCFANFRECDPDICVSCIPYLSRDLYDEALQAKEAHPRSTFARLSTGIGVNPKNLCCNMSISLSRRKKLRFGKSRVHGWGCFAGEDIKKDEFITEYVGEIITQKEADRRGLFYDRKNLSFLFNLNYNYVVDAALKGNKMKFANHSLDSNMISKILTTGNGGHRIAMFAKRNIKKGEEFLFDYGHENVNARLPDWL